MMIFSVMATLGLLLLVAILVGEERQQQMHHDSRKGSFYEISNRKEKH